MDKAAELPYLLAAPAASSLPAAGMQSYRKPLLLLILLFTLARLLLASVVELGNDEAYYWLYTRNLQWNYFDHPPMVALQGWLTTAGGLLNDYVPLVRLGSILGAAIASLFIYKATATLYSPKAGWYAAVLYNTSFYAGLVAGMLLMPDSPQMLCWTFAIWMAARLVTGADSWRNWLLFGLGAGLCILCKVHGVFLWGGMGLYVLLHRRQWLQNPRLYAAAAISLLLASPILYWNFQYDFVTYRFHSERVVVAGWGINWRSFAEEVLGQILFNNPYNYLLTCFALAALAKGMRRWWRRFAFLVYMALPLVAVLLYLSLFRTVYPHWSGPAYVSLLPLAAIWLARQKPGVLFPAWLKAALFGTALFMTGWPVVLHFYPGTWGQTKTAAFGDGDVSLDRYGWKRGGGDFAAWYGQQVASGAVRPGTPLVCPTWWGAHVEYYFARPAGAPMIGLGSLQHTHHYLWTNYIRKAQTDFTQAFCIVPSDEYYNPQQTFAPYYRRAVWVQTIALHRNGQEARRFYVYRLDGWKGRLPQMPPQKEMKRQRGVPVSKLKVYSSKAAV
ncbi:hypothetical protein BUE76_04495 [Cnuella takakiae]|nr:hypothetical protein BUE76_04495 [Cnuella takakiae]